MAAAREITLTLPRPHPSQQEVLRSHGRFNVVACGRRLRWGKTTLNLDRGTRVVLAGKPYGYFAPTYKNLAETWRVLADRLEPVTRRRSEQEKRVEAITGGVWECWSLDDPAPARGRAYAEIGVDEAAHVVLLEHAWQNVLRPTLTDYSGSAWFYSTPNGRNFFYQLYRNGLDPDLPQWQCWQFPSTDNPHLPAADIEEARQTLPERVFQQEYLAAFIEDEGAVFRRVSEAATLEPSAQHPNHTHTYVIGVDWGRYQDFTVLCVLDVTTREQVALDRFQQLDWEIQYARLSALCARYRPALIVAERNAMGDPAASALRRLGLPVWDFVTSNATKAAAIQSLALALEQGELGLLKQAVQTDELLAYEAERLPSGMIRYGAPQGQHDDCVMALAMAWVGAEKEPGAPRTRRYSYTGVPPKADPSSRWLGPSVNPFKERSR